MDYASGIYISDKMKYFIPKFGENFGCNFTKCYICTVVDYSQNAPSGEKDNLDIL